MGNEIEKKKKRISLPITRARNTKYSGKNVRMQKVTSGESILFHMMRLPMKNVRNAKFTISASTISKRILHYEKFSSV